MTLLLATALIGCNFGLTVENPEDTGDPFGGDTLIDGDGGPGDGGGGSPGDGGGGVPGGDGDGGGGAPGGDTTDTTDTTPDDGGDDGGGAPANNSPEVLFFDATVEGNSVVFDFDVEDIDGDMTGGSVTISVGSDSQSYTWPNQIQGSAGAYHVSWNVMDYDRERSYTASIRAKDNANHTSDSESATFERDAWSATLVEDGDDRNVDFNELNTIELPAEISGDIYGTGYMSGSTWVYGDQDWFKFKVNSTENVDIILNWSASADYDLYLADAEKRIVGEAYTESFVSGETISYRLTGGENFFIGVAGWEGGAGSWTIRIE